MTLNDLISEAKVEGKTYITVGEEHYLDTLKLSAEYTVEEDDVFQGSFYTISWSN